MELIDIIDQLDGYGLVVEGPELVRTRLAEMGYSLDEKIPRWQDKYDVKDRHFGFDRTDVVRHAEERAEELDAEDDGMDHSFSDEEIDRVWATFKARTKHGESMSVVGMNELIGNLLDKEHAGPTIHGTVGEATEVIP